MVFLGIGAGILFIIILPVIIADITNNDIWFFGLILTVGLPITYLIGVFTDEIL